MFKRVALVTVVLVVALAGCGQPEEQGQEDTASGGNTAQGGAQGETQAAGGDATEGATGQAAGEVTVGGFMVEGPGGEETRIPEASVGQEELREYRSQVEPIVEGTVRDISGLVQPEVSLQDGELSVNIELTSLREAQESVRSGLEELRALEPPQELAPINEQLIASYEDVLPAYEEIVAAAESGDLQRLSTAVEENLQRIERFNNTTQAILQDLEQASEAVQSSQ